MITAEQIKTISQIKAAAKAAMGTFRDSTEYKEFYANVEALEALATAAGQGKAEIDFSELAPGVQQQLREKNPGVQKLLLTEDTVKDLMGQSYHAVEEAAENYVNYKMKDHSLKPQSSDVKPLNTDDIKKLAVMGSVLTKDRVKELMNQHELKRGYRPEKGEEPRLALSPKLEADSKLLVQTFAEISAYAGLGKTFSVFAGMTDSELSDRLKTELSEVTDQAQRERMIALLQNGAQAARLLDKLSGKNEFEVEDMNRLKQSFAGLNEMARTTLRDDVAEVMSKIGPGKMQVLAEAARACGILAVVLPSKLQDAVLKSAVADQNAFRTVQDDFSKTRYQVTGAVGLLNLSSKGIIEEYKDSCKTVQYSLGALRALTNGGKTPEEIKAINERAAALKARKVNLKTRITHTEKILKGTMRNPIAELEDFNKRVADTANPLSPFFVSDEEQQLQEKVNQISEQKKKIDTEIRELNKLRTGIEYRDDAINRAMHPLRKSNTEEKKKLDELTAEKEELGKQELELKEKLAPLLDKEAQYSLALAELQVQIDAKARGRFRPINDYLEKYGIEKIGHVPSKAETKKLLTALQKKLQKNLTSAKEKKNFDERMFTQPEKYLQEVKEEYSKLLASDQNEVKLDRNEKEVAAAGKKLQMKNAERKDFEKVAGSFNKLCRISTERKDAFDKAVKSAKEATSFHFDGEAALMNQLKGIAKHMEDKRRLFHTDSAEYSALKKALNDIVEQKDIDKLMENPETYIVAFEPQLTTDKLKKLQMAANQYLDAKNSNPSRFNSSMRLSRIGYAQELADICTLHIDFEAKNKANVAAAEQFLEENRFENYNNELEPFDSQHRLENSIKAANVSFDKQLEADGMEDLLRIAKQAADVQSQKQGTVKAPSVGGR